MIVPFLSWIVDRVRPDAYNFIAAAVCIAGIGLVSLGSGLSVEKGDVLTLVGGFFFAAHMVAVARFGRDKDPAIFTAVQFAAAAVPAWIVWAVFESRGTDFAILVSPGAVFDLVYLIVGATAACMLLQNIGQKYTDPSSAALILTLESVFGVIFSVIFYHERLTPRLAAGFSLIFIAVVISETKLGFLRRRAGSAAARKSEDIS